MGRECTVLDARGRPVEQIWVNADLRSEGHETGARTDAEGWLEIVIGADEIADLSTAYRWDRTKPTRLDGVAPDGAEVVLRLPQSTPPFPR